MTRLNDWGWWSFGFLIVAFMTIPLILVVLFSFGDTALANFPMGGITLKWYDNLFSNPEFWKAFQNSMVIAGVVVIVSAVIGTMSALTLARMRPAISQPLLIALCLPVMMPPLVIAIALLLYFVRWVGIELSLFTVILGHLVVTQPFVIMIVYARMATFDYELVDSARDLGASAWTIFLTVTLPIIRSTIIGAALIALAISLDEIVITFFNISGGNTLPTFVFGKIRTEVDPTINAIAAILLLLTVSSTIIAMKISRYRA